MKDRLINSEVLIKSLSEGPAWHENMFCVWLYGVPSDTAAFADHPRWTLVFQIGIGEEVGGQETPGQCAQSSTPQMQGYNHQAHLLAFFNGVSSHLRCKDPSRNGTGSRRAFAHVVLVPIPQQHAGGEVATDMAASLATREGGLEEV